MEIAVEPLEGEVAKIVLRGRFDTTGAVVIELPFNAAVADKRAIIADLSGVTFLSSYGIRVLLVGAKIAARNGGRFVILCPDNNVLKALNTAGTSALIPIFNDEAAARAAVAPA